MFKPPNDYRDPYWRSVCQTVEKRLGLPTGLLHAIVVRGEKTPNDRVSAAKARTVFQITDKTRDLFLKKYGIDRDASPLAAGMVAGYHLLESLNRHGGNVVAAVAEYHAGPDKAGWGPKTNRYALRVVKNLDTTSLIRSDLPGPDIVGMFGRSEPQRLEQIAEPFALKPSSSAPIIDQPPEHLGASASEQAPATTQGVASTPHPAQDLAAAKAQGIAAPTETTSAEDVARAIYGEDAPRAMLGAAGNIVDSTSIDALVAGHRAGTLSKEVDEEFMKRVKSGAIMLSQSSGVEVEDSSDGSPNIVPQQVLEDYFSDKMSRAEKIQLENDVKSDLFVLPPGVQLGDTEPRGFFGRVADSITGNDRRLPETEKLRGWLYLPELMDWQDAKFWKTMAGTLASGPKEIARVIKRQFPGVAVREDRRGTIILKSGVTGEELAIHPGMRPTDVARYITAGTLGVVAAAAVSEVAVAYGLGTVAASAIAGAAEAGLFEAGRVAGGEEFDPVNVAIGAGLGPAAIGVGRAARALAPHVRSGVNTVLNRVGRRAGTIEETVAPMSSAATAAEAAVPRAAPRASAAAEQAQPVVETSAPQMQPTVADPAEFTGAVRRASGGAVRSSTAEQAAESAARQVAPDTQIASAASELGVADHLTPGTVTTQQAVRDLEASLSKLPSNQIGQKQARLISETAKAADDIVAEFGGLERAELNATLKQKMLNTTDRLHVTADKTYDRLSEMVPKDLPASASATLEAVLADTAHVQPENVSRLQKRLRDVLTPKVVEETVAPGVSGVSTRTIPPTYADLDVLRREIGASLSGPGPFVNYERGVLNRYYGTLTHDIEQAITTGVGGQAPALLEAGKRLVGARKALEDDIITLFGRKLEKSIVPELGRSVRSLASGDTSGFVRMIKAVPEKMRQSVTASGLMQAFERANVRNKLDPETFVSWYESLATSPTAKSALFSNLPPQAAKSLDNLYHVSRGIVQQAKAATGPGKSFASLGEAMLKADTAMSKVLRMVSSLIPSPTSAAASAVAGTPMPSMLSAISNALNGTSKHGLKAIRAADNFMADPDFMRLILSAEPVATQKVAQRLAKSKAFIEFAKSIGNPRELSDGEKWLARLAETTRQVNRTTDKDNESTSASVLPKRF